MTEPPAVRLSGLRLTLLTVPATVVVAGGLASALDARSLLVAGAILIGWSQLVGL